MRTIQTTLGWVVTSWRHYYRTHVVVLLGVMIGTAVISGALIVGDSMRESLRQLTLRRLGPIAHAVHSPRFFRQQLARELAQSEPHWQVAPALILTASADKQSAERVRRASQITVYGVDEVGWNLLGTGDPPRGRGVVVNTILAEALQVQVGDTITLWLEVPSSIPRETLLGRRDQDTQELPLQVQAIVSPDCTADRFGLQPTQFLPKNAFIPLETLQEAMGLEEQRPTRRDPRGAPARINALLVAPQNTFSPPRPAHDPQHAAHLTTSLQQRWQASDWGLRWVHDRVLNVWSLESEQLLLPDELVDAISAYAQSQHNPLSPVLVYLANWIRHARQPEHYAMYSTVAGLDVLDLPPEFGPWTLVEPVPDTWMPDEVLINDYLAHDLRVNIGDEIELGYHRVGSHGELPEETLRVKVRGIVQLTGAAADPQLTPEVKGITDADSLAEWEQPFPMELDKVTPRDDEYWNEYRATPKMFFRLEQAQRLWGSRYGRVTSLRIAPVAGQSLDTLRQSLQEYLQQHLSPAAWGMQFVPVKALGLQAAQGSTDFSGLFLGFSLYLIGAAMMLVGLLFRLSLEQRVNQWGLLAAIGWPQSRIQRLWQAEAFSLVLGGCVLGSLLAIGYAQVMLYGLKTWWIGAVGTRHLVLEVRGQSLMIGGFLAAVMSWLAIWTGWRKLRGISLRGQLVGESEATLTCAQVRRRQTVAAVSAALATLLVVLGSLGKLPTVAGISPQVAVFFTAGVLWLIASLSGLSAWLGSQYSLTLPNRTTTRALTLWGLARRQAARRPSRSVFSAGLIAAALFLLTAVSLSYQDPTRARPELYSGNGGFTLVAESSRPVLFDLNTAEGRRQLGLTTLTPEEQQLWEQLHIFACRVRPGDDASCLNLFQTQTPTLIGVPPSLIARNGFAFVGGRSLWPMLAAPLKYHEGLPLVPVLGDVNSLLFSLKKKPGDRLAFPQAGAGQRCWLEIAGMFSNSVFQGVLVLAQEHFDQLFPEVEGYRYFLIACPEEQQMAAETLLESKLSAYGFDVEPVAERLARFLTVQNTYLATFQSLGGLGLILGTLGLAMVMLRNVWERLPELALLRAVGWHPLWLSQLLLLEAAWLLAWGLISGILSAVVAMWPHIQTSGEALPWGRLWGLTAGVALVGMLATWWAVQQVWRISVVSSLRGE
ncbi:MAG: ABC transporter permease [Planctomycetaceae bacterium]|nr:MAG: ABC transporter permease [Planctomycetaceae bacterium]